MKISQLSDKYRVTVEFTVPANSPENAEDILNEIIKEGILMFATELADMEQTNGVIVESYDIVDAEPAEIDLDVL